MLPVIVPGAFLKSRCIMIIGRSEIEWHDANELPSEREDLLIMAADKSLRGVFCGEYERGKLGFHIPDDEGWRPIIIENVLGWAYFPTVHFFAVDKKGKFDIFEFP